MTWNKLIKDFIVWFLFIVALAFAGYELYKYFEMPVVKVDYITGDCIRVENCDCDCDSLPVVYINDLVSFK